MVCSCPLLLGQNDYELAAEFGDVCDRAAITGCLDSLRTNDSKWSAVSARRTVTKRTGPSTPASAAAITIIRRPISLRRGDPMLRARSTALPVPTSPARQWVGSRRLYLSTPAASPPCRRASYPG